MPYILQYSDMNIVLCLNVSQYSDITIFCLVLTKIFNNNWLFASFVFIRKDDKPVGVQVCLTVLTTS